MNKKSITTSVVTGIAIIAILILGYFYIVGTSTTARPLTTSSALSVSDIQIQSISSQLTSLSFDTGVFSDPRFIALKNINAPIVSEPIGRTNPFAPI